MLEQHSTPLHESMLETLVLIEQARLWWQEMADQEKPSQETRKISASIRYEMDLLLVHYYNQQHDEK